MIAEYSVNLKNKTKDELIMLLQEALQTIHKLEIEINYKDEEMFNIINSDKGKLFEKNKELFEENKELKRQILSLTYTNNIKEK